MTQADFMRRAIALSLDHAERGIGGPFGAVIVKDGVIIGEGGNEVTTVQDPTAHAEIVAIRRACVHLNSFTLAGCEIYTSCEPCPMCLGAIYWARISRIYFGNSRIDAAAAGFDDAFLYDEISRPIADRTIPATQLLSDEAQISFDTWDRKTDKILY